MQEDKSRIENWTSRATKTSPCAIKTCWIAVLYHGISADMSRSRIMPTCLLLSIASERQWISLWI